MTVAGIAVSRRAPWTNCGRCQCRKGVKITDSKEKGRDTRIKNQEAQRRRYAEQAEGIRVVRLALQRIMEAQEATPTEILEAARLLVEIGKW